MKPFVSLRSHYNRRLKTVALLVVNLFSRDPSGRVYELSWTTKWPESLWEKDKRLLKLPLCFRRFLL